MKIFFYPINCINLSNSTILFSEKVWFSFISQVFFKNQFLSTNLDHNITMFFPWKSCISTHLTNFLVSKMNSIDDFFRYTFTNFTINSSNLFTTRINLPIFFVKTFLHYKFYQFHDLFRGKIVVNSTSLTIYIMVK